MSRRSSIRFMQKEQMKLAGLEKICKPIRWDGESKRYRSTFAMHWRNFPDMGIISVVKQHVAKHTKRNLKGARA